MPRSQTIDPGFGDQPASAFALSSSKCRTLLCRYRCLAKLTEKKTRAERYQHFPSDFRNLIHQFRNFMFNPATVRLFCFPIALTGCK